MTWTTPRWPFPGYTLTNNQWSFSFASRDGSAGVFKCLIIAQVQFALHCELANDANHDKNSDYDMTNCINNKFSGGM
jgi:hypothetical protein